MTDSPALSFPDLPAFDEAEARRLRECSTEELREIGRIQSFGSLIGIDEQTGTIVVASDDRAHWLGRHIQDADDDRLAWAVTNGAAIDPVRVSVDGRAYDAIVHRGSTPLLVELEAVPVFEYARLPVVSAIQRLATIKDADELRQRAVEELKTITGFDRVMCYQFHADGHGQVAAEAREPDMEPYFGLHFPSSDIPPQARALYFEKRSRVIADTLDPGQGLQSLPGVTKELNLGPAELRAVSPHHLQFMRNMGQAATVSFALIADDTLIGLITCAHRTPRRLPVLLRRSIEVLASQVALQLSAAEQMTDLRRQLAVREQRAALTAPLYGAFEIPEVLFERSRTVLDLIPADGVVLMLNDRVHTLGMVPPPERLLPVIEGVGDGFVTEALSLTHPNLARQVPEVAGLIVVAIGDAGHLAFVRGEVSRTVDWLGDQSASNRDTPLSPRRSFSSWRESVTGRCAPWGPHVSDAFALAADIHTAIGTRSQAELAELALRDSLTGLHNRRFLKSRLDDLLQSASEPVSVIFLDLDNFKQINDTHGHEVGDVVLATVGKRLAGLARSSDIIARLGGDEFVMVCVDVEEATPIASRLIRAISRPISVGDLRVTVSASAGTAPAESGVTAADVLSSADAAMYRAKRDGRGRTSR